LETRLHKEMCAGHISLKQARDMMVNDWRVPADRYSVSTINVGFRVGQLKQAKPCRRRGLIP